ncbi:MAG: hypothetical protein EBV34_18995 [Betaproteobacteria bacterium]|nr:hypothetical protein [Betaproteobacteria bacterium]
MWECWVRGGSVFVLPSRARWNHGKRAKNAKTLAPADLPPPKWECCSAGGGYVADATTFHGMWECPTIPGLWDDRIMRVAGNQPEPEDAKPLLRAMLTRAFLMLEIVKQHHVWPDDAMMVVHSDDEEGNQFRKHLEGPSFE